MRKYECTFIINPEKEEEAKKIIEEVKTKIEENSGKVEKIDEWGIKELAYEINGYNNGFYTVINFETEPGKIDGFKEFMKKNNSIIRFLTVVKEK